MASRRGRFQVPPARWAAQQRVRIGSRARSCAAGDPNFFAVARAHIFSM
jgi:hypothetical protein